MNRKKTLLMILALGFLTWSASACSLVPIGPSPTPWSTRTVKELIEGFSSTDAAERAFAAGSGTSYYNHPDKALLIPYLVEALSDPDTEVRMFAANSIRVLGIYDEQAVETLISWLDEEGHSRDELGQGIQALEAFAKHASGATPGLVRVMMNPPSNDPGIRQATVYTLAAIGDPVAVPYIAAIFLSLDEQSWLHRDVATALAKFGPETRCVVPYLVPLLDSSKSDARIGAALVISQATESTFPGSERRNWDPDFLGAWVFEKGTNDEYLIVNAANEWWQKVGQHEDWPQCEGLDGKPVLQETVLTLTALQ